MQLRKQYLLWLIRIIRVGISMNAFDKSHKNVTAWCEDCESVFDTRWAADMHQNEKSHRVKVTEFWITSRK
jgi:hypothetical protein